MKYYIISGEASGDLHGAGLVQALKKQDADARIRCWGGDRMQHAGAELVKHYRDLAFMGFTEVLRNLPAILKNLKFCKQDILSFKPDVLILIDYPGFNLRIASFAKKRNIRVFYYISPQIWAWKANRGWKIKHDVERMFVILPFEAEFYKRYNMDVSYHGHPLIDRIGNFQKDPDFYLKHNLNPNKKIIALLPGSRKQEINRMLPVMLDAVHDFEQFQVLVAGAPSIDSTYYRKIAGSRNFHLVQNDSYQLLAHAHAVAVTSGTATLETALFGVPMVVCYAGGQISYLLARQLIQVKYISLVNLILNKQAVPELIQSEMNPAKLNAELNKLLFETNERKAALTELKLLRDRCGEPGVADRIAEEMIGRLKQTPPMKA